eukprot:XP_001698791.1 predicted protein [Chlamydomonas reinhardtii]
MPPANRTGPRPDQTELRMHNWVCATRRRLVTWTTTDKLGHLVTWCSMRTPKHKSASAHIAGAAGTVRGTREMECVRVCTCLYRFRL